MKNRSILALLLALLLVLTLTVPAFASEEDAAPQIKNVIFMIGDGMGENHLLLAKEKGYDLFMDKAPDLRGQSMTRSFSHRVTDSAAGATALACGVRNLNRGLGVYWFDPLGAFARPQSITEAAIARGMKTGIVTSDSTAGATPSGFSVHCPDRALAKEITRQQMQCDLDLIWGRKESEVSAEEAEKNGWTFVSTEDEMNALEPGTRSFGQFGDYTWRFEPPEGTPTLTEMSLKAISLLNADNENGFFLMIEGAHIDKMSHNKEEGIDAPLKRMLAAEAVKCFDNAVRAAVDFARRDGHTLVVITADHETGDLYLENGEMTFHSAEHTGKNVPLFVYGADDLFAPGEAVENRSIPVRIAAKLGWDETELPKKNPGFLIAWLKDLPFVLC